MRNLTKDHETALEKFRQISDVLAVPTIGNPLPTHRKWTLPRLDEKALADLPPSAPSPSGESTYSEPPVQDPPKQTARK